MQASAAASMPCSSTGPLAQEWIPGAPALARVLRQQPPATSAACLARQAVRQRPPRRVLQCRRRCRHRAVGIRHRGRGGGTRLCPHQRHPQPRAGGLGVAGPAGSRLSGRGAWFRLAVAPASCEPAPAAVGDGTPRPLQRGRHRGDRRRLRSPPRGGGAHSTQRATDVFGTADFYGWSEDKVRQYARPERADWGAFVRKKGFRLE